jgi:hypothetical protein
VLNTKPIEGSQAVPYIITTTFAWKSSTARHTMTDSRVAVATLDEAHQAAQDAIDAAGPIRSRDTFRTLCWRAAHIPQAGGSVGPLPDGTTIEVEPTYYLTIAENLGLPSCPSNTADLLAAFNAAQEQTA